jgi:DNA polymerase III sliding clamp (beta) subunit (PCNA family)
MNNLNSVLIEGVLKENAQLHKMPNGKSVCTILVMSKRFIQGKGKPHEVVSHFTVEVSGNLCDMTYVKGGDDFPDFDKIVVPPEVLQRIAKRKQDSTPLSISVSGKDVCFNIGSASVTTATFSEEFIKFIRNADEFPEKYPLSFTMDRVLLLESLGQVSIATEIWKPAVNIELSSGTLALHTGDDDCSANTEIPCDYSGENMVLAFHVKYFTEIIEHICTERVTIRFDAKKESVVILPVAEQNCFYFLAQRKKQCLI